MRIKSLWILLTVLMAFGVSITHAQQNLLIDGGFETPGDFKVILQEPGDDGVFGVPQAWGGWITTTPRNEAWQNKVPNGFPHTGVIKTPAESTRSLHISRGFASFTVGVYQQVTVADKTNLTASAWGFMERANNALTGAQWRVGIDVAGGTTPFSPTMVWSNTGTKANAWEQLSVSATSQGTRVTFWLYATQSSPSEPNGVYFDTAVLTTGGAGGTPSGGNATNPAITNTPVIPTPAFAPFVAAQPTQSDGSIVHTVVAGDTLDAIAVAYGTTRDELLKINNLPSARFLQIGQKIIIRPARPGSSGSSAAETPASTTTASGTASTAVAAAGTTTATLAASPTLGATVEAAAETTTPEPTLEPSVTPTPEPSATPTTPPPAPVTEVAQANTGVTAVCVWMFNDANQNRIQEDGEAYLQGGSIVINAGDQVVETYATTGQDEPFCFEEFAAGNYTVAASAPEGYGLTTASQLSLRVQAGARINAKFGAAEGVAQVAPPPVALNNTPEPQSVVDQTPETTDPTQQLLQIGGLVLFGLAGLVLVGGVVLAFVLRGR